MSKAMPLDDLRLEQIRDDATGISEEYMTPSAYQDDLRDLLAEIDRLSAELAEARNSPSVEELIAYLDGMLDVLLMPSRLEDAARSYLQDRES